MRRVILLLMGFVSPMISAQDHRGYIPHLKKMIGSDPLESAILETYTEPGKFLSVGNGYAPSRPGFETVEEMKCAMVKHGFNMVWAGGDVLGCENQRMLGQKAESFAGQYNKKIKAKLIEQGAYKCAL